MAKEKSNKSQMQKQRISRIIFFLMILLWCIGLIFPSLFNNSSTSIIAYPFLKQAYSGVCHQSDVKTFTLLGHKLLVCARCTGIYLGALLSVFALLFSTKKINITNKMLYYSMLPMAADVVLYSLGIYHYSKLLAYSTGLFLGSVVITYILAAFENNFLPTNILKNEQE